MLEMLWIQSQLITHMKPVTHSLILHHMTMSSNGHGVEQQDQHHLRVQEILKAKLRESQESDLPESQASTLKMKVR